MTIASVSAAAFASPAWAVPTAQEPSSQVTRSDLLKDPRLAAALPWLGPAMLVLSPNGYGLALWPFAASAGYVYAEEANKALPYVLSGQAITVYSFLALLGTRCGRGALDCTPFDPMPWAIGAGLGLTAWMSWDSYRTVVDFNAKVSAGAPFAEATRNRTPPLFAGALSTAVAPVLYYSLNPVLMTVSPLGCGVGHLVAGHSTRAGWVMVGGVGAAAGGSLAGLAVERLTASGDAGFAREGAFWALLAYSLWAGWDAYRLTAADTPEPARPLGFPAPLTN